MPVLTPPSSSTETLVFDPTSEDAANVPLTLTADPYVVVAWKFPTPQIDARYAQPADADGDPLIALRYRNREISLTVAMVADTDVAIADAQRDLAAKIAKLNRYGGTLQRTLPDATVVTFDVLEASMDLDLGIAYTAGRYVTAEVSLVCKPEGRGTETSYSAHTETSLPVLVFTETTAPTGDLPALGRLVITDASGADQLWAVAGVEVENFDTSDPATKKLFYEAEGRTALNTAAVATVTGASGGGSNNAVSHTSLPTSFGGVLSTQATGGGSHLAHIGNYRVFARIQRASGNSGTVSLALDWSVGDFLSYTRNATVTPNGTAGSWEIVDLGNVRIPEIQAGSQRWEGRIVAKSTVAGDDLSIDCLWLVPTSEFSGEANVITRDQSVTSYDAGDSFLQTAGSATGKTLQIGGTWTGAGDADDFSIDATNRKLTRAAVSDTATSVANGRLLTASTPTSLTTTFVSVTLDGPGATDIARRGVIARYVDSSNFLAAYVTQADGDELYVVKVIAGTATTLASLDTGVLVTGSKALQLQVNASGAFTLSLVSGGATIASVSGYDSTLLTAGTLDNGTVGVVDWNPTATSYTRSYDDFYAYAPTVDAVVYASQSMEIRHDGVIREDSGGSIYAPVSKYEGDLCVIPPAGPESRGLRCVVKASRGNLDGLADTTIDDITARLYYTPRYLVIPS